MFGLLAQRRQHFFGDGSVIFGLVSNEVVFTTEVLISFCIFVMVVLSLNGARYRLHRQDNRKTLASIFEERIVALIVVDIVIFLR